VERYSLTYEQFGDEHYIVLGDDLIGRIVDMGSDNYYIRWESEEVLVPIHGFDNAKRYVEKYYTETNRNFRV
jgi:hypothetical protein